MNELPEAAAILMFALMLLVGGSAIAWIWDEIMRHRASTRWQRAMDRYLRERGRS